MQRVKRFRPELITISLLILVGISFLLSLVTGLTSIKEAITYSLIIVLLSFLTIDIKKGSTKKKSTLVEYRYFILMFLFSYLTLF